jgi:hypothetical protein
MDEPRRWAATYLDGRSAASRPTHVRFDRGGLTVEGVGVWPYHLIRIAEPPGAPGIRLETAEQPPQAVTVADPLFRDEIARCFPTLLAGSGGSCRGLGGLAVLACGAIALLGILWFWVLPALPAGSAGLVPLAFEEQLGEAVAAALAPASKRCANPETIRPVEEVVRALVRRFALMKRCRMCTCSA